jgi:membrane protein implicated in regulation of membrane protease activity
MEIRRVTVQSAGSAPGQGSTPTRLRVATMVFSVLIIGAIMVALILLLIPLVAIALVFFGLAFVLGWLRLTVARLRGRELGSGRRNVRVVGPDRGS